MPRAMKRHLRLARTAIIVACLASLLVGCPRRSAQENQAEIHLYAAQIHLQDKQPKLALTQLELARELVPDYPKTHLLLGVAYANGAVSKRRSRSTVSSPSGSPRTRKRGSSGARPCT